ncbi:hypothetical protein ACFYW6_34155 [Streptomyces sp. NPDC002659]|uniref:hypothetical protein n=1 Tax=Streptomyces sp. NPDC002659 TaxID=3364656 RepID=UPI0036B324EB
MNADKLITAWAAWSPWVPLHAAQPPRTPGVYLARQGADGPLVYVGMAGVRSGAGLSGRLKRYTSGRATTSGLGEAALDRALADPAWLRERLHETEDGRPMRATEWGKAALQRADIHVCWSVTDSADTARCLEQMICSSTEVQWWNRTR